MNEKIEPYRLFFPLGIFYGIWGVLGWIVYFLDIDPIYPVEDHFRLMTYGFMLAFVCGFAMTATPKQTQTWPAAPYEIISVIVLMILNTFVLSRPIVLFASTTMIFIILNLFIYDRYKNRQNDVDAYFIFTRIGFFIGFIHSLLSWAHALFDITLISNQFMKILFYDGFILMIIIGVGTTLIPNMFGYKQFNVIQINSEKKHSAISRSLKIILILLILSFLYDLFFYDSYAKILRFILITILFNNRLYIFKLPVVKTRFTLSIYLSILLALFGYGISAFFPDYYIHSLHLMLIGGFGLMIILIASRVTLAHGNYGFEIELKSKLFYVLTGLITLAAFTRFTAIFLGERYISHLGYAAMVWALSLVIWAIFFFKKMLIIKR
jgi:uncharacterized protein involved in response to NO